MEIRHHPRDLDFSDKRVTVVGLGIEGVDVARYLSRQGAMVTVSDSKPRQKLSERLQQVDNLGLKLALGSNQLVERSPHVAAVLNITPNHLDHFSWEEYRKLKARIIRFQQVSDIAVLGLDDAEARSLGPEVKGQLLWFSLGDSLPGDGVLVSEGWAVVRFGKLNERLFPLESARLRGRHNQANAVAAAAVATACGVSPEAIACAVQTFRGGPHRVE